MWKNTTCALICVAMLAACSNQTFDITEGSGSIAEDNMSHFFVGGIGQKAKINARQICGGSDKVVSVETQQTFLNGFLGFLSFGIYTPMQYRVTCRR